MKLVHICPGSWGSNCYLLISGGEAYVVDPSPSADAILKILNSENAKLKGIILTHGHFDHILSAETLNQRTNTPIMIHEADNDMLADSEMNAFKTFFGKDRSFRKADRLLHDSEMLPLGGEQIEIIHTPGHTKGCICLKTDDFLLTGDTLFGDSFGRIDLYGGSLNEMKQSLLKLKALNQSLTIYPGHGEFSTLSEALAKIRFLNR